MRYRLRAMQLKSTKLQDRFFEKSTHIQNDMANFDLEDAASRMVAW